MAGDRVVGPPAHGDVVVDVDERRAACQRIGEEPGDEEGSIPQPPEEPQPGGPCLLQRLLEQESERFLLQGAVFGFDVQRLGSEESVEQVDDVELREGLDLGALVLDRPAEQVAEEIPHGLRAEDRRVGQAVPPP